MKSRNGSLLNQKTSRNNNQNEKGIEQNYNIHQIKKDFHFLFKELYVLNSLELQKYQLQLNLNNISSFDSLYETKDLLSFHNHFEPIIKVQIDKYLEIINNKSKEIKKFIKNNSTFSSFKNQFCDIAHKFSFHSFGVNISCLEMYITFCWRIKEIIKDFTSEYIFILNKFFSLVDDDFIDKMDLIGKEDGAFSFTISLIYSFFCFFGGEEIKSLERINSKTISNFFEVSSPYRLLGPNDTTILLTKQVLLQYLVSPTIVEAYLNLFQEKKIKKNRNQIKKMITKFLENFPVFFFRAEKMESFGFLIENGTIYIEKPISIINNQISLADSAVILSTLIHEVGHGLLRFATKGNMYEKISTLSGSSDESGEFVESQLFGNRQSINMTHAAYIMNLQNYYNKNLEKFSKDFSKIKINGTEITKFRKKKGKTCTFSHRRAYSV